MTTPERGGVGAGTRPRMRRTVPLLDGLVILWSIAWILIGVTIAREVRDLARLSDTVVSLGQATQSAGAAVAGLEDLPVLGGALREPATKIREAGADAVVSARESRRSADRLAVLLGISVALIPSLGLLAVYLPRRVAGVRERRALLRALRRDEPNLDEYLAWRALSHLTTDELSRLTSGPLAELTRGRAGELARAELRRHGLDRLR